MQVRGCSETVCKTVPQGIRDRHSLGQWDGRQLVLEKSHTVHVVLGGPERGGITRGMERGMSGELTGPVVVGDVPQQARTRTDWS